MKFKKLLSILTTVAVVAGCLPGIALATETDETSAPTELVTEAQEDAEESTEPEEGVEPSETEVEVIEDSDVYSVTPANASTVITVSSWDELKAALENEDNTGLTVQMTANISAVANIGVNTYIQPVDGIVLDMNGHTLNMQSAMGQDQINCYAFRIATGNTFTINDGQIVNSFSKTYGGAINNYGILNVNNVDFSGNHGEKAAIYNNGTMYLYDVTLTDNRPFYSGGGAIYNDGMLDVTDILVYDNSSNNPGAGIYNNGTFIVHESVFIHDNYSSCSMENYHVDNLYLKNNCYVTIGDDFDSGSIIWISGESLPNRITDSWDGRASTSMFHFEDHLDTEVRDGEVYGVIHYYWLDFNNQYVEQTIYDQPIRHYLSGEVLSAGTYYFYENQTITSRLYATGEVNIILADGSYTVSFTKGLDVSVYGTTDVLSIYGQSDNSGTLRATGESGSAGIGGNAYDNAGLINIYGGTVIATGGSGAAGIGGGQAKDGGSVTIWGGNVTATGSNGAADIGAGAGSAYSGTVSINGGNVILCPTDGAHIGHGEGATGTNIDGTINFGYVSVYIESLIDGQITTHYYPASDRIAVCTGTSSTLTSNTIRICTCSHSVGTYVNNNDGTHRFTCDYCGYQENQPHNFENGHCVCDNEVVPGTAPQFIGHSMQLTSGQIGLQYFVTLPSGVAANSCYVTFEGNGIDSSKHYTLTSSGKTDVENCYMVQIPVSSIMIAERYAPTLHYPNGTLTGAAYSVFDYINWGIAANNTITSDGDKNILTRLGEYGYYAQQYLSTQNNWTYGVDYAAVQLSWRPTGYEPASVKSLAEPYAISTTLGSNFISASFSMRFGDQMSLRVFFVPLDGSAVNVDDFSVFCGDLAVDPSRYSVTHLADGRYAVTITGISTIDLRTSYTIRYNDNKTSVVVSPMSYVYAMMCQTNHEAGQNLVCSLFQYAAACGMPVT